MRTGIKGLLLAGIMVVLLTPVVWGEYYQYTDVNGVLRYTDNIAAVPPDQRPDVKTYESVKSSPVIKKGGTRVEAKAGASLPPVGPYITETAGNWNERLARQAEAAAELDRIQADLNRTFVSLQNEKAALMAKVPPAGASVEVAGAYKKRVDALNAKIGRYESQLSEFRKKEAVFKAFRN